MPQLLSSNHWFAHFYLLYNCENESTIHCRLSSISWSVIASWYDGRPKSFEEKNIKQRFIAHLNVHNELYIWRKKIPLTIVGKWWRRTGISSNRHCIIIGKCWFHQKAFRRFNIQSWCGRRSSGRAICSGIRCIFPKWYGSNSYR